MLCPYLYYPHLIRPCLYYLYMYHLSYSLPAVALHLVALTITILYPVKQACEKRPLHCPLVPVQGIHTCSMH